MDMEVMKMRCKRTVKIIIDIAMYLLFVALMQEHLWEDLHEWIGIMLFVLFIAHNVLNFRWYQSLFKGKYTPAKDNIGGYQYCAGCRCAVLYGKFSAGFGKVFAFSEFGRRKNRQNNSPCCKTAWAFVLMSLHLGLHLTPLTNKLKRITNSCGQVKSLPFFWRHTAFMCLSAEPFTKNCFISPSLSFLIPINRQFYTF